MATEWLNQAEVLVLDPLEDSPLPLWEDLADVAHVQLGGGRVKSPELVEVAMLGFAGEGARPIPSATPTRDPGGATASARRRRTDPPSSPQRCVARRCRTVDQDLVSALGPGRCARIVPRSNYPGSCVSWAPSWLLRAGPTGGRSTQRRSGEGVPFRGLPAGLFEHPS
jgi:hypothetical protein